MKPVFVTRVGYPKVVEDYIPEVDKANPELFALLEKLLKQPSGAFSLAIRLDLNKWLEHRTVKRIKRDLAYLVAKGDGFGGKERTLHTREVPDAAGKLVEVYALKNAVTGTYFPPYYPSSMWEDDYEPGGLTNEKRHRLAHVSCQWFDCDPEAKLVPLVDYWIETVNLEKVEDKSDDL